MRAAGSLLFAFEGYVGTVRVQGDIVLSKVLNRPKIRNMPLNFVILQR